MVFKKLGLGLAAAFEVAADAAEPKLRTKFLDIIAAAAVAVVAKCGAVASGGIRSASSMLIAFFSANEKATAGAGPYNNYLDPGG